MFCMDKLCMLCGFTKGGKCGCFVLVNKWHSWVQSALCAIRVRKNYLTIWLASPVSPLPAFTQSLSWKVMTMSDEEGWWVLKGTIDPFSTEGGIAIFWSTQRLWVGR